MNRRYALEFVRFLVVVLACLLSFGCSDESGPPLLLPKADAASDQADASDPPPRMFAEDELTAEEREQGVHVSFRVLGVSSTVLSSDPKVPSEHYWQSAVFIAESLASFSVSLQRVWISIHAEQVLPDTREFIDAAEFIDACQLRREMDGVVIAVAATQKRGLLLFDLGSVSLMSLREQSFQLHCSYRSASYILYPIEVRFRVPFDRVETSPDINVGGTRFQDSPIITVLPRSTKE